jgi:hypothetical protein
VAAAGARLVEAHIERPLARRPARRRASGTRPTFLKVTGPRLRATCGTRIEFARRS